MKPPTADGEDTDIKFKRVIIPDYHSHLSFENKSCKLGWLIGDELSCSTSPAVSNKRTIIIYATIIVCFFTALSVGTFCYISQNSDFSSDNSAIRQIYEHLRNLNSSIFSISSNDEALKNYYEIEDSDPPSSLNDLYRKELSLGVRGKKLFPQNRETEFSDVSIDRSSESLSRTKRSPKFNESDISNLLSRMNKSCEGGKECREKLQNLTRLFENFKVDFDKISTYLDVIKDSENDEEGCDDAAEVTNPPEYHTTTVVETTELIDNLTHILTDNWAATENPVELSTAHDDLSTAHETDENVDVHKEYDASSTVIPDRVTKHVNYSHEMISEPKPIENDTLHNTDSDAELISSIENEINKEKSTPSFGEDKIIFTLSPEVTHHEIDKEDLISHKPPPILDEDEGTSTTSTPKLRVTEPSFYNNSKITSDELLNNPVHSLETSQQVYYSPPKLVCKPDGSFCYYPEQNLPCCSSNPSNTYNSQPGFGYGPMNSNQQIHFPTAIASANPYYNNIGSPLNYQAQYPQIPGRTCIPCSQSYASPNSPAMSPSYWNMFSNYMYPQSGLSPFNGQYGGNLYASPPLSGISEYGVPEFQDLPYLKNLRASNASGRSSEFSDGLVCKPFEQACEDGSSCVPSVKWCDGVSDCPDASDEVHCSCKQRIDKGKLCDGYFDCPFGEDELNCFGCAANEFSCDDWNKMRPRGTCVSIEKRCDNRRDCFNGKDEAECSILTETVEQNQAYLVSYSKGYLHRNWRGHWYPVCPWNVFSRWAIDACQLEVGPHVKNVQKAYLAKVNDYKGAFIVENAEQANGRSYIVENCIPRNSAVYIQCPPTECGTRSVGRILGETLNRLKKHINLRQNLNEIDNGLNLEDDTKIDRVINEVSDLVLENDISNIVRDESLVKSALPASKLGSKSTAENEIDFDNFVNLIDAVDDFVLSDIESDLNDTEPGIWNREILKRLVREEEARVVGGTPSNPGAWPWLVLMNRDGYFHCGGVIIDESWILTAAHCVMEYSTHYYEIQAGVLRRFSFAPARQIRFVTNVIVNENYNRADMRNDLALLKLNRPLIFNRSVRQICFPPSKWPHGPHADEMCTAVGWGAVMEHGPDPDHVREVKVPILPSCKHRPDQEGREICAGYYEGGVDTCQGDSGGPLLCKFASSTERWYVAGIVSHGEGCARPGEPGVYTRVGLFSKWIVENADDTRLPDKTPLQDCPGKLCSSGHCVALKHVCDGIVDCLSIEDEIDCGNDMLVRQKIAQARMSASSSEDESENDSSECNADHMNPHKLSCLLGKSETGFDSNLPSENKNSTHEESSATNFTAQEALSTGSIESLSSTTIIPIVTSTPKNSESTFDSKKRKESKSKTDEVTATTPDTSFHSTTQESSDTKKSDSSSSTTSSPVTPLPKSPKSTPHDSSSTVNLKSHPREGKAKFEEEMKTTTEASDHATTPTLTVSKISFSSSKPFSDVVTTEASQLETKGLEPSVTVSVSREGKSKSEKKTKTNPDAPVYTSTTKPFDTKISSDSSPSTTDGDSTVLFHATTSQSIESKEKVTAEKVESYSTTEIEPTTSRITSTYKPPSSDSSEEGLSNRKPKKIPAEESKKTTELDVTTPSALTNVGSSDEERTTEKETSKEKDDAETNTFDPLKSTEGDKSITESSSVSPSTESTSAPTESKSAETEDVQGKTAGGENSSDFEIDEGRTPKLLSYATTTFQPESTSEPTTDSEKNVATSTATSELVSEESSAKNLDSLDQTFSTKMNEQTSSSYAPATMSPFKDEASSTASPLSGITVATIENVGSSEDTSSKGSKDNRKGKKFNQPFTMYETKLNLPKTFTCKSIEQYISRTKRCDGVPDCFDKSDEQLCSCQEYLLNLNSSAVCDGIIHCEDSSDEMDCDAICSEEQFNCARSKTCIPKELRCDNNADCRFKEDEENCYALSSAGVDEKPDKYGRLPVKALGVIVNNFEDRWHNICLDETDDEAFVKNMANRTCVELGFDGHENAERSAISREENCDGVLVKCSTKLIGEPNPWQANIYVDGAWNCPAILIDYQWLLADPACDFELKDQAVMAVFGQSSLSPSITPPGQQITPVNNITIEPLTKAAILHLKDPVKLSASVKPLFLSNLNYDDSGRSDERCVAIMQDGKNSSSRVFLNPAQEAECKGHRCFSFSLSESDCTDSAKPLHLGDVTCLGQYGWYIAARVTEPVRCESDFLKLQSGQPLYDNVPQLLKNVDITETLPDLECEGLWCDFGNCVKWDKVFDGHPDCITKEDESQYANEMKDQFCINNPSSTACEKCAVDQLQCSDNSCIPLSAICDGELNCPDGLDEPKTCSNFRCVDFLKLKAPGLICNNKLNCYDKSDEEDCPKLCDLEDSFKCQKSDRCLPPDLICDNHKDCPEGEDEELCLSFHYTANRNEGMILRRSFGVLHPECLKQPFKTESFEKVCKNLGFEKFVKSKPVKTRRINVDSYGRLILNQNISFAARNNLPLVTFKNFNCQAAQITCE